MRRPAVAGIALVWLSLASGAPPAALAVATAATAGQAAVEHRAAVIVDTGARVKSVCVRFREESISGVEALALAQVDPVLQAYSGKGAAVCALCGVGCPAGDSCLTCNPDGKFWSYSRAPAGTGSLLTSGAGASSTTVHDGDVEGWKWALGGAPPFQTVEQVCGEAPAPSTSLPATTSPALATTAAGPAATVPVVTAAPATTRAPPRPTTTAAHPGSTPAGGGGAPAGDTTTPSSPATAGAPAAGSSGRTPDLAASRRAHDRDGGGKWPGLAVFGVALAGLTAWGVRAGQDRARRRN